MSCPRRYRRHRSRSTRAASFSGLNLSFVRTSRSRRGLGDPISVASEGNCPWPGAPFRSRRRPPTWSSTFLDRSRDIYDERHEQLFVPPAASWVTSDWRICYTRRRIRAGARGRHLGRPRASDRLAHRDRCSRSRPGAPRSPTHADTRPGRDSLTAINDSGRTKRSGRHRRRPRPQADRPLPPRGAPRPGTTDRDGESRQVAGIQQAIGRSSERARRAQRGVMIAVT